MIDPDSDVAIFWDYENCTPSSAAPGYDVVENIRQIAHKYGSVKLFKAYLEISEQPSPNSNRLRSELVSCGVSLTDCPHNGRKDVADKMMIVDMLTYAIDKPAPATLIVISGDRDFVYAVSVLRWRRYRVVLVAPNSAHASLRSQASAILDWEADVLGKRTVNASANMHRRRQSSISTLVPTPTAPPTTRGLSFRGTPSTPSVEFFRPSPDVIDPHRLRSQSNPSTNTSVTLEYLASSGSDPQSVLVTPVSKDDPLPAVDNACPSTLTQRTEVEAIVDLNDTSKSADEERSRPNSSSSYHTAASIPSDDIKDDGSSTVPAHVVSGAATMLTPGDTSGIETSIDAHIPIPIPCSAPPAPVPRPIPQSTILLEAEDSLPVATPLHGDLLDTTIPSDVAQQPFAEVRQSTTSQPAQLSINDRVTVARSIPEPLLFLQPSTMDANTATLASSSLKESPATQDSVCDHTQTALTSVPAKLLSSPISVPTPVQRQVPARFIPLLRALDKSRLQGFDAPLYNSIANIMLKSSPDAYETAGVNSWKEYATLAEKEGIIIVGGPKSRPTISLAPEWQDNVTVSSSSTVGTLSSAGQSTLSPLVTQLPPSGPCGNAGSPSSITERITAPNITPSPPTSVPVSPSQSSSPLKLVASTFDIPRRDTPAQFVPLVRSLERALSWGYDAPMYDSVAYQVGHDYPDAYELAGVKRWTDYAALAEKAGIVVSEGPETKRRMSLAPAWRPPVVAASVSTLKSSSTGCNSGSSTTSHISVLSSTASAFDVNPSCLLSDTQLADPVATSSPSSQFLINVPFSAAAKGMLCVHADSSLEVTTTGHTPSQREAPPKPDYAAALRSTPQSQPFVSPNSQPSSGNLKNQVVSKRPKSPTSNTSLPLVPAKYKALVQILEKHRSAGEHQPMRCSIADALVERDRNVYKHAGVQRWHEYAAAAVRDGIIKLGGPRSGPWVSLEPAWYDRAPQSS